MGKTSGESDDARKWQHRVSRKQAQVQDVQHKTKKVRHELHKVRERLREFAEAEKFTVQRAIASFHKVENKNAEEYERCHAQREAKERELATLKEQLSQLQERTREQRAEVEAQLEAKIASMREENRRIAASTQ